MSYITWQSKQGELAIIAEGSYFEHQLLAKDSQGLNLTYSLISGKLGSGLQLFKSGLIQGVPIVEFTSADLILRQTFTIRATNTKGKISDRTFSIVINQIANPTIIPKNVSLGTFYDGYYLDTQLTAIEMSPTAVLSWEMISGELPGGVILTPSGRLFGNIESFHSAESDALLGWSNTKWNSVVWDSPTAAAQNKTYQFKVRVADGTRYDTSIYTIKVQAKSLFTVDNTTISANDDILTVDVDNKHIPFITTLPIELPDQRQDSNFGFKIEGKDLDGDAILFGKIVSDGAAFDQGQPGGPNWVQDLGGHPTEGDPADVLTPPSTTTAGFDEFGFAQEGQSLPPGVYLDPETGWLYGHLLPQSEERKTYKFQVYCYKKDTPKLASKPVTFTLTVLGSRQNTVTWITPEDLGTINNGSISEIAISAVSDLGKPLTYRMVEGTQSPSEYYRYPNEEFPNSGVYPGVIKYTPQARSQLPQGLKLLPDGLIVGRAAFDYFSLDNGTTTIDKNSTEFDNLYQFSITASDEIDNIYPPTVSAIKTFTVKVNNWNSAPYENIYLRALPNREQRITFASLVNDESIFPPELLYRKTDEWFGKAKDIKFLFAAGLAPSLAGTYIAEMQHNHYNKIINLGNVKTAVALDDNFKVKYEIVYVSVTDPLTEKNKSPAMSINRLPQVKPPYTVMPFTTVYPNSLDNMKTEVTAVGYTNKGSLPEWMVNQQEDGRVLGFTRGVVLAYTIPGASKLIAFRLQKHNANFNEIDFVADRYQLDHTLSTNYNIPAKTFIDSKETTFDRLPTTSDLHPYAGAVNFAVTVPFDEINGRTLEYISRAGGISGATIKNGQLLVFAVQEHFARTVIDETKDTFDANVFDIMSFNSGITPKSYESANDGWNLDQGLFGGDVYAPGAYSGLSPYYDADLSDGVDSAYYDDSKYAPSTIVPGYLDHLLNPDITNMRSGIWRIVITDENVVTLEFVNTVNPMEYVRVSAGNTFGGSKIYYDPIVKPGHSVPEYTLLTNALSLAGNATRFDGGATCFFNNKDLYASPGENDVFLKFPKHDIYR